MSPNTFDLANLRRYPDVEAPNLFAVDATDRLLLDTAAEFLQSTQDDSAPHNPAQDDSAPLNPAQDGAAQDGLVVLGDHYGALTLGAANRFGVTGIRVHQDPLTGELALAHNAERFELTDRFRSLPLTPELVAGAKVVLIQAPKSLAELADYTELIAEHAAAEVTVLLGGRVKYLTPAMNDVLGRSFTDIRAGLARQKSRVIMARQIKAERERGESPRREWHQAEQLWVCAFGGAFAGTSIDIGTRRLVELSKDFPDATRAIDLGCGTGVLAALLARQGRTVLAVDESAAACASAQATAEANDVSFTVVRDDALAGQPDASADLIVCNPPFHLGGTVHTGAADRLFRGAARVLADGGQLWTVYNRHLGYRPQLQRLLGPTRIVHQTAKFTVTVSTRTR